MLVDMNRVRLRLSDDLTITCLHVDVYESQRRLGSTLEISDRDVTAVVGVWIGS